MYIPQYEIPIHNNQGAGGNIKNVVDVYMMRDIANLPVNCDGSIFSDGAIVMKPNKYPERIFVEPEKTKKDSNSVGDYGAFENILTVTHPGSKPEIENFIINRVGQVDMLIVIYYCRTGETIIFGDVCSPMRLTTKGSEDKDKNIEELTFKSALPGNKYKYFTGTLPSAIVNLIPVDATVVDVSGGSLQYTTNIGNTAAHVITGFSGMIDGMVFSIIGGGGLNPQTIVASSSIILQEGATWTANANSFITFKVKKTGSTSYSFIEQYRG